MDNPQSETERLRAMLQEDLDSPDEAEALLSTVERLKVWEAPPADPQTTVKLIETLKPEMLPSGAGRYKVAEWWPFLMLCAQMRVVRGELWTASALVMAFGAFVTLAFSSADTATLPFVLTAPVVAAVGIAFLYGPDVDPALEIQLATPAPPRLVLMARLLLLFGFDLAVGLIASAALAAAHADLSLWPLVMAWLAPMTFLSALAFFLGVVLRDPMTGMVISVGLWALHAAARFTTIGGLSFLAAVPDLTAPAARPWLFGAGLLVALLAFWFSGYEEQWVTP